MFKPFKSLSVVLNLLNGLNDLNQPSKARLKDA